MKTFFTPGRIWPTNRRLTHIYYLPDTNTLAPLLDAYAPTLQGLDFLTPVPPEWLHATLLKITTPMDAFEAATEEVLLARLRAELATVSPLSLLAGPALAGASAVVLDLTPDHHWNTLCARIATAIDDVLGPGTAMIKQQERPHITLAYGIADGDSGEVQSRLRRATDQRVPLQLDRLHLVDVIQDLAASGYRWTPRATLDLRPT
ncbi:MULTISPECIES: 2'-5' RNA ligase family protein [unclassified Crossiella]|uniref:2'-5' RNA ligase family protein n=1 Tax=unclassified Crossiella TaxID=2620835 RepID=UPI001FFF8E9F|nr:MULTISPECIES: 2'-5' RNA ligase family protein [unclassified Crossiella]MCK2245407.1 2'-5' RNA ligase family protein [Crossiella sp. S99.2]MCK2259059.1 2'-5' RNA ligase family protein [Crossiella sp. S99.1]